MHQIHVIEGVSTSILVIDGYPVFTLNNAIAIRCASEIAIEAFDCNCEVVIVR